MKRIIFYSLVILIVTAAFYSIRYSDFLGIRHYYYISACDTAIPYRIGDIDYRFGLSQTDVLDAVDQASQIWNDVMRKQLFLADSQAILTINMVYDKRQALNSQINQLEDNLNTGKTTLKAEIEKFEKLSIDFEKRLNAFKEKVNYWNAQGGAPQEEYDKLIAEQQSLNEEADRVNAMAGQLNLSTDRYNTKVGELNQTIRSFKNELEVKPEEGVYNPQENRIDIYFNINRDELVRTIAHELGHARELPHSTNKKAIMYPSTTNFLTPTVDEIESLKYICRDRPFYEPLIERISLKVTSL